MSMQSLLVQALVSGVVDLLFFLVLYYGVQRRESLRDEALKSLTQRVEFLQDRELKDLKESDRKNSEEHGRMFRRMDQELTGSKECRRIHDDLEKREESASKRQSSMNAQIQEMNSGLGEVKALTRLIASHLHIDWKGVAGE